MEMSISPLDGRYGERLSHLGAYFSEFALMRMRCRVELLYVEALNSTGLFESLSDDELSRISEAKEDFTKEDFRRIKEIELGLHHDVKACEVFLREKTSIGNRNLIHFGLTSEDINNLAYNLLFKEFLRNEQVPLMERLLSAMCSKAEAWVGIPLPTRTHGQMASPSTVGKELAVFISRILRQYKRLDAIRFTGKINGATGNYSAVLSVFPDFDWLGFSRDFVDQIGLMPNLVTTQIEDHDTWAQWFSITRQMNNIILDLNRDIWHYLMLGYLKTVPEEGSVGSSTMPHKVNPINFENSEGNLEISNALLGLLIDKLTHSRMQRDLSDSTVTRNIGVALAHSHLALMETLRGLGKLSAEEELCRSELLRSRELLTEPIQTILKAEGIEDPYTLLKDFSQGKAIGEDELARFIDGLEVHEETKSRLRSLRGDEYVGLAEVICEMVLVETRRVLSTGIGE